MFHMFMKIMGPALVCVANVLILLILYMYFVYLLPATAGDNPVQVSVCDSICAAIWWHCRSIRPSELEPDSLYVLVLAFLLFVAMDAACTSLRRRDILRIQYLVQLCELRTDRPGECVERVCCAAVWATAFELAA